MGGRCSTLRDAIESRAAFLSCEQHFGPQRLRTSVNDFLTNGLKYSIFFRRHLRHNFSGREQWGSAGGRASTLYFKGKGRQKKAQTGKASKAKSNSNKTLRQGQWKNSAQSEFQGHGATCGVNALTVMQNKSVFCVRVGYSEHS